MFFLVVALAAGISAHGQATTTTTRPTTRPLDPDLVGWWRADRVAAEGLTDLSGKGHAARPAEGKVVIETADGRAGIRVSRDRRAPVAGADAAFDMTADFTAALWVKLAPTAGDVTLLSKGERGGGWAVVHGIRGLGGIGFVAAPGVFVPTPLKATDAWVHVAVTFHEREFLLYVDGKQIGIRELDVVPPPAKAALTFGASPDGQSAMDGWLDDVRIYHRALSVPEVEALAAGREPAIPYAKFDATEEKQIRALILQLGADSYAKREQAAAALRAMGRKAYPMLRQYRDYDDLEVASRVKVLLGELPSTGGRYQGRK